MMLVRGVGANRPVAPAQHRPRPSAPRTRGLPSWTCLPTTSRCQQCRATKIDGQPTKAQNTPKSAREAIETATQLQKEQKDYKEAVRLYVLAMEMKPNEDEARAALYNMGCALAKQKQWASSTECILRAINDYNLKLTVALKDDDLKELRDRREWVDALMEVKGGLSRNAKIDLRSEAKAPFRFPRLILFGGIGISAAVGLVIISFRLIAALKGGDGAPDLQETLQNFGINSVAVVLLGGLVYWDLQGKNKSVQITGREEALGRLQIDLGGDRQLPLLRLRGQVRPVVISGSRGFVEESLRAAAKYETKLRNRGVSVVPVILDEVEAAKRASQLAAPSDPAAKIRALKREFQQQAGSGNKGFGKDAPVQPQEPKEELPEVGLVESDKKWRLAPYQVVEWKEWLDEQKEFASLPKDARDVYVQIQMDGTVRSSGQGKPNWSKLVDDLPPLDTMRSSLMDGIGSTEV